MMTDKITFTGTDGRTFAAERRAGGGEDVIHVEEVIEGEPEERWKFLGVVRSNFTPYAILQAVHTRAMESESDPTLLSAAAEALGTPTGTRMTWSEVFASIRKLREERADLIVASALLRAERDVARDRAGPHFTPGALANIRKTGISWQDDLADLRSGRYTPESLLADCLADSSALNWDFDPAQGWLSHSWATSKR